MYCAIIVFLVFAYRQISGEDWSFFHLLWLFRSISGCSIATRDVEHRRPMERPKRAWPSHHTPEGNHQGSECTARFTRQNRGDLVIGVDRWMIPWVLRTDRRQRPPGRGRTAFLQWKRSASRTRMFLLPWNRLLLRLDSVEISGQEAPLDEGFAEEREAVAMNGEGMLVDDVGQLSPDSGVASGGDSLG